MKFFIKPNEKLNEKFFLELRANIVSNPIHDRPNYRIYGFGFKKKRKKKKKRVRFKLYIYIYIYIYIV